MTPKGTSFKVDLETHTLAKKTAEKEGRMVKTVVARAIKMYAARDDWDQ